MYPFSHANEMHSGVPEALLYMREFGVFEASAVPVLGSGGLQCGLPVEGSLLSEWDLE